MRPVLACVLAAVLVGGCKPDGHGPTDPYPATPVERADVVHLAFGGDVMLGRGVAPIARADPWSIFSDTKTVLAEADLAVANMESPLTRRPHRAENPNALEALPSTARVLRAAGFDAMSVANNHAGDAGPGTAADSARALRSAGIVPVGLTSDPVLFRRQGVSIAVLAFDASPPRAAGLGIATWDPEIVRASVAEARAEADIVAVSLHGGTDYRPEADPYLARLGTHLARWGADIVWGHGPHLSQPVRSVRSAGRSTVVATSLGNLVFDHQGIPGTDRGTLLDIAVDREGVLAFRVGLTTLQQGRVDFEGWEPATGDAVALLGGWWTATRPIGPTLSPSPPSRLPTYPGPSWDVLDAKAGDVNGDGEPEVIVAFRWPFSSGPQMLAEPDRRWIDALGRKAVVGVYSDELEPVWISTSVRRPVSTVAPCVDALVVAYTTLDAPATVGTGLWPWRGYGFTSSSDLPGPGVPGCADVDTDGVPDPVVTGRSEP
jgi:hypothetical protein